MRAIVRITLLFCFVLMCNDVLSNTLQGYLKSFPKSIVLAENRINKIIQDQEGYIWVATANGLYRFDGHEYEQHAFLEDEKESPLRPIKDIQLDDYGRIWITGNRSVLHYYAIEEQKLVDVNFRHNNRFNTITVYDSLLIMEINGRLHYTSINKEIKNTLEPIKSIQNIESPKLRPTHKEQAWHFLKQNLVQLYFGEKLNINKRIKTSKDISSCAIDAEGNSWVCNGDVVSQYNQENQQWTTIESLDQHFINITYDKTRKKLWLLTKSNVFYLDKGSVTPTKLPLLCRENVQDLEAKKIFVDAQGNVWLITKDNFHLICFPKNNFYPAKYQDVFENKLIAGIHKDPKGNLCYSTMKRGFTIFDPSSQKHKSVFGNYIRKVTSSPDSLLIINYVNYVNTVQYDTSFNMKVQNTIRTKPYNFGLSFKKGTLWIADFQSIKKYTLAQLHETLVSEYQHNVTPNDFQYDTLTHSLLLCTSTKGLMQLELDEYDSIINIKTIDKSKGLRSNLCITSLKQKNKLWIATSAGLSKFIYNKKLKEYELIKNYTKADGLTDNRVVSIVEENDSTLWVATNAGLNKLNIPQNKIITYHKEEGFISNHFSNRTSIKTKDGRLQFGTVKGLVVIDPKKIKNSDYTYTPFVSVHSINGEKGYTLPELNNLAPHQKNIQLKVSIPNYISPKSIRYRYKLQQSEDWKYSYASQKEISLYNLDFGTHTFIIQVSNENNEWNSEAHSFPIYINTPFWLKWWFILACVLVLMISVALYIRFSVKQFSKKRAFDLQLDLEKKLRETDQEKIKFFTDVSHDLKTPLTMISEPIEKMNTEELSEQERKFLLKTVSKNTNRLIKLVHKALEFGTSDKQEMSLNFQKVELISFIKELVEMFMFEAKEKEVFLDFKTEEKEVILYIDKEKIERVVFNIMTNALKNTVKKDKINIILVHDRQQEHICLSIKDTGNGIKEEKLKHLFNRFYQADAEKEGQGIGLSIVKRYVEAHEGTVDIASKEGQGTQVSIQLPKKNIAIEIKENDSQSELVLSKPQTTNAQHSVLIVEDDQELREYMIYELSSDYILYVATNGEEGIAIAETKLPDLIITDFMMPKMSGEKLCETLKNKTKTAHIPIIMITAMGQSETQLLSSGANDFIAKPFKVKNLKLKIKNSLSTLQSTKAWVERELHLVPQPSNYQESEETIFVKKLMEVIDQNLMNEKLSVGLLAKEVGISKTVLYRKTPKLTGYTVNQMITSVKLKKAAELIVHSSHTFSEISFMLGYNSIRHFRKLFKEKYQMTMQDYKQKHLQA